MGRSGDAHVAMMWTGRNEADMSQSTQRAEESTSSGGQQRWFGLVVVAAAQLMIVIDMTIINVALPSIDADLAVSDAARQWIITAYSLTFGGLLLLGGRISDHVGRKRALLVGLFGFAAASVLGGLATSLEVLTVARVAQGAFAALLAPASLALLTTTFFDPRERGRAFAVFGVVVAVGSPIGLVLGGVLTTFLGWQWVMFVNAPIAAAVVIGAIAFLRESRAETHAGYDVPGAALATAALVLVVYGFSRAAEYGWGAPLTIGSLAAGLVFVVAFIVVESRVRNPLLPLSVLLSRSRGGAYLVVLLMMTGPFGAYLFIGLFLQGVQGYSALAAGLALLPLTAGVMVASGVSSQLMTRVAPRFVICAGLVIGAVGMALLTRLEIGSTYWPDLVPGLILIGIGMGLVLPPALELATSGVRAQEVGVASAMFNVSNQIGASLATALLNTVATVATAGYLAMSDGPQVKLEAQVEGYNNATIWAAGILLAAGLMALAMINTRPGSASVADGSTSDAAPERGNVSRIHSDLESARRDSEKRP